MLDGRTPRAGILADVGGGTGVGTEEALRTAPAGTYARCVVLDPQRGMLLRARRNGRGPSPIHRVRGSGDRLPLADACVDVVISFGVLCCMEDADVPRAVSELGRILRPGGYCLLGVPLGWAEFTEPLFRTAGFRVVDQQRPGRALYQRPVPGDAS
jgi:SAM-dependent methyltransferase